MSPGLLRYRAIFQRFARERRAEVEFHTADGDQLAVSWRTTHGYVSYITLSATSPAGALSLRVHAFPPSFTRTRFVQGREVTRLTGSEGDSDVWAALLDAWTWADGLQECVDESGRTSLEPILEALGSRDATERWTALTSLTHMRDPRTFGALREALAQEADPWRRAMALQALSGLNRPEGRELLRCALEGDPDEFVRNTAALNLAKQGDMVGLQALVDALERQDYPHGERSAQAIPGFAPETIGGALLSELCSMSGPQACIAAQAISKLPRGLHYLVRVAEHPSPAVRSEVARLLASRREDAARVALTRLVGDPDEGVRDSAAAALSQQRDC
jgi:hypothetical protein